ncbi:MAG: 3-dehydroquinate synthase [bacterium]|nr:3-dehydroquinate synthase [bacterium]
MTATIKTSRVTTTEIHNGFPVRNALTQIAQTARSRILLITDDNVKRYYNDLLIHFHEGNPSSFELVIPAGESAKTISTYQAICDDAIEHGFDRSGVVIAFGGGVVSDLAGFVAATLLRGVPWFAIPTTVIGAIDAAIGGKTGVNTLQAKNALGAFHPPQAVYIDPTLFSTLPKRELQAGWGEIAKYGILAGGELWKQITETKFDSSPTNDLCNACIRQKIAIVEQDPFESGIRKLLNLGHTAGHALEAVTRYEHLRHGEAVAWGIGVAAELSQVLLQLPIDTLSKIEQVLQRFMIPPVHVTPEQVVDALRFDKKRINSQNDWILFHQIGAPEIVKNVPIAIVESIIAKRINFLQEGRVA